MGALTAQKGAQFEHCDTRVKAASSAPARRTRQSARLSVASLVAFFSSLLAVACSRATVASSAHTILGRRRAIIRSRSALGPGELGLIRLQGIADRGVDVTPSGSLVSRLCGAISGVSGAIGLVALVVGGHETEA